jgi:hypothetical protein
MSAANNPSVEEMRARLQHIKDHMPQTYELICAKAVDMGDEVWGMVRRGVRGVPNEFWAMEAGHFAGTPFDLKKVQDEIAWGMVNFGDTFAVVFNLQIDRPAQQARAGGNDGAH